MASVVNIERMISGDQSEASLDKPAIGAATKINDTDIYIVTMASESASAAEARTASLSGIEIPLAGAVRSDGAICSKVSAVRRDDDPCIFDVTVNWASTDVENLSESEAEGGEGGGEGGTGGTERQWNFKISVDYQTSSQQIFYGWFPIASSSSSYSSYSSSSSGGYSSSNGDLEERELVNTVNEPLDPIPENEIYDAILTISFQTNRLNAAILSAPLGRMNDDDITFNWAGTGFTGTISKHCALLVGCPYSSEWVGNRIKWNVEVKIAIRNDTWITTYLNESNKVMTLDANAGKYVPILATDANGDPEGKVLINAEGKRLPEGAKPIKIQFFKNRQASFTALLNSIQIS